MMAGTDPSLAEYAVHKDDFVCSYGAHRFAQLFDLDHSYTTGLMPRGPVSMMKMLSAKTPNSDITNGILSRRYVIGHAGPLDDTTCS